MIPGLTKKRLRTPVTQRVDLALSDTLSSLVPGTSVNVTVTATRTNQPADLPLEAVSLPVGVTASFDPEVLTGDVVSSVMTLTAAMDAPEVVVPDAYTVRVPSLASVQGAITIGAAPLVQRFVLGGSSTVNLPTFNSADAVITVTRSPGYTNDITLLIEETLPDGVTRTGAMVFSGDVTTLNWTFVSDETAEQSIAGLTIRGVGEASLNATRPLTLIVGGWSYPNAGGGVLGPGPHAPAWAEKVVLGTEDFSTPIPVHYAASNVRGFKGYDGFDGAYGGGPANPTRVTYPLVGTPIGYKPVMRVTYPGSRKLISGVGQSTVPWSASSPVGVRVTGTWSGRLNFESSTDGGVTWNPVTYSDNDGNPSTSLSGSSTTINGTWRSGSTFENLGSTWLFRVTASEWISGTAVVDVGMRGGSGAAPFNAGGFFGANPKRFYTRALIYVDPTWDNNGNSGTKWFFFCQGQNNNHYVNQVGASVTVALQPARNGPASGVGPGLGVWVDFEMIAVANTIGVDDGILQVWVNGEQKINRADFRYFVSGQIPRFTGFWCDGTFGGGGNPPNHNQFVDYAGWYTESAA